MINLFSDDLRKRIIFLTMVLRKITLSLTFLAICPFLRAQLSLDSVHLKSLKGSIVLFPQSIQKDSLILVCFWQTTSDKSVAELNAINSNYEQWKSTVSFRMLAVAV